MKKIKRSYIIFDILTVLALTGAYETKRFAYMKLGFVRYLNHYRGILEGMLSLGTAKVVLLCAVLLISAIASAKLLKRRSEMTIGDWTAFAAMIAIDIYYAYVTATMTSDVSKASFMIVPIVALGALMITIRNLLGPSGISSKTN